MNPNTANNPKKDEIQSPVEDTLGAIEQAFQDEIIDNRDESKDGTNFTTVMYAVFIVFFVIIVGLVLMLFYNHSDQKNETIKIENASSFQPILNSESSNELVGMVVLSMDDGKEIKNQYQIVDNEGNIISYIYSEKIDLSIAQGLTVRIKGVPDLIDRNGYKVLNVSELEFK